MEHMDVHDRRSMRKGTLRTLLFLRGNWQLLQHLVEGEQAKLHLATQAAYAASSKRRREAADKSSREAYHASASASASAVVIDDSEVEEVDIDMGPDLSKPLSAQERKEYLAEDTQQQRIARRERELEGLEEEAAAAKG